MSRRPHPAEQPFGSDSFLDVVANVVGILIILMVLAGVRAGRTPVQLSAEKSPPTSSDAQPVITVTSADEDTEQAEARQQELTAWQERTESLERELQSLRLATEAEETKLSELQSLEAVQRNRVGILEANLAQESATLQQQQQRTQSLLAAAQAVRIRLKQREADLAAAERQPHHVEQLQHQITPVSRVITENDIELHFRCLNGAVTIVPIEDLVERMKGQMERQRDVILRLKKYSGSVGPVRGWSMHYIVEAQQHLGFVRASVSQFELVPEADLEGEPAEVAVRPDSQFRNELRKADPGSTITFWVYPDSFALFRKLQALAHREGFSVAARPLPEGTPIMGSPHGSRSAAQ